MVWSDEGSPARLASSMPHAIVRGAQYMNDAMGSVYGKFTQALNYERSTEFRGGIWDCNDVKETVPSKPSCMDTLNNPTNKIFTLEEMLACYDEENDTEMKNDDDSASSQNKVTDFSINTSDTDVLNDVKTKRWRSEEFDKAILVPSNDSGTTRKKSKKNVTFSDTIVDLEDSSNPVGMINKCVAIDVTAVKDNANGCEESLIFTKSERAQNSTSVSENIIYAPAKMNDKETASETKSVKENLKIKNWKKLMSQSGKIDRPDQQQYELKHTEVVSSKKLSEERRKSRKAKSIEDHETVLQRSVVDYQVKNEELMDQSHFENIIPQLKEVRSSNNLLSQKKCKSKNVKNIDSHGKLQQRSAVDHLVKNEELINRSHLENAIPELVADELSDVQNPAVEIKKSSCKENCLVKGIHSRIGIDSYRTDEVISKTLEEKNNEDRLKNCLLEVFDDDSDIVESITFQLLRLKEKRKKMVEMTGKVASLSDDKQMDCVSMARHEKLPEENCVKKQTCHEDKFFSEDESQSQNSTMQIKKACDKPSYNLSFEKNRKLEKDVMNDATDEVNSNRIDDRFGEVSSISQEESFYQGGKIFEESVSISRSDSCSNWRNQCIDIRQKDKKDNLIPQNSLSANWRNECTDTKKQHYNASRNNHYTRRIENFKMREISNKMDVTSKVKYVDVDMVVVPLNLKEPPDPDSRFKVNVDPESIWEQPEEKMRPSRQIQSQNNNFDLGNGAKSEEIRPQLFKGKTTSIPRFFDSPSKAFPHTELQVKNYEDKHSSPRKIDIALSRKMNENYRSRSQSRQGNNTYNRSGERNRSASVHWRNSISTTTLEQDVFYVIKVVSHPDGYIEKLKILKEDFLVEIKENGKLSDLIPSTLCKPKKISYSACAVKMLVRCVFSSSYKIPSWIMALEAFALAKKYGVDDLRKECEVFLTNYKMPSEEISQVAACAYQLQALDALKYSKFFEKIQNSKTSATQHVYTPQSCSVSCSVLTDPSEFTIPLLSEINRGLESCNKSDVKNLVMFKSLAHVTSLTGIQLKFLKEDVNEQLHIICEVFLSRKKLFSQEFDTNAKSTIKISFDDEINVKLSEQVEISVVIEDVLLKMCPQLTDKEFLSHGKFHASFESSKTSEKNKKLFCIEKLFYASQVY